MKRLISIVLVMVLCIGLMAGCGTQGTTAGTPAPQTTASQQPTTTQSATVTKPTLAPVKLSWYVRFETPKNYDSAIKKANEIIGQEINATLTLKCIAPGEYNDKMNLIMQSSEEYDICFTSSWSNIYSQNVARGAYIALDDYVAKYPDIKGLVKDVFWEAIKIQGKTYAIPNLQVMYTQMGLWFRKDLVEKYKLDVTKLKKTSDLTPIFQVIKDNEPGVYCLSEPAPMIYFLDYAPIVDLNVYVNPSWKVYDRYDTDMVENYKVIREWYKKGFMPSDASTLKDHDSLIKAGKVFSRFTRIKPGGEADLKAQYGFDVVQIATSDPVVEKTGVLSTMSAISVTSKNPDRAMMLLNLMNTNKILYNTLVFGTENLDYKKVGANRVQTIPDTYFAYAWQLGNNFNAYVKDAQPDNVWEETRRLNDAATLGKMTGFTFDKKNVENEYAQATAINQEFDKILDYGLDDTETVLKKRTDKLKAANYDKLLQEMQAQVDTWVKANIK